MEDMRKELQKSRREIAKLIQEIESRKLEGAFAKDKRGNEVFSSTEANVGGDDSCDEIEYFWYCQVSSG